MKRHLGRTLMLVLAGLLVLLVVFLRSDYAGDRVCTLARRKLPAVLGMEVGIGRCRLDPLRGGVEIVGFYATPPDSQDPLIAADRALVRLSTVDFLRERLRLDTIVLDRPRLNLDLTRKPKGKPGGPPGSGCYLDPLDRVELDRLAINGGQLHVILPGGRRAHLEELDVDLRRRGRTYSVQLTSPAGLVQSGRIELPLTRLRIEADLNLARQQLVLEQLELGAADLSASVKGTIETLCSPEPSLEASVFAPLDLVSALLGEKAPRMAGTASISLRVEGIKQPNIEAEVALAGAQIDAYEIGDALVEARLERDQLRVERLDVMVGEGRVRARGTVGTGAGHPIAATVEVQGVEFAQVLDKLGVDHAHVNFLADGRVDLKGQALPFHLAGPAALEVKRFRWLNRGWDEEDPWTILQFDRTQIELAADFTSERAHLGKGRLRTERSEVLADATLHFREARGLQIEAEAATLDLADFGHITGIPLGGQAAARVRVEGPYSKIGLDASLSGRGIRFHKLSLGNVELLANFRENVLGFPSANIQYGRSRFFAEGEVDFRPEEGPHGRGRGSFEGARMSDLLEVIGDEHWVFDLVRGRLEARASGTASVEGPIMAPHSDIHLTFTDSTYFERRLGDGELTFRSRDGELIAIDTLRFDGPCGPIAIQGTLELDRLLDFRFDIPRAPASELALPDGAWMQLEGMMAASGRLVGPPDHPVMDGTLTVTDLSSAGVSLGSGTLALHQEGTYLTARGPVGSDFLVDARFVLREGAPFAVGVSANTQQLGHYLPFLPQVRGTLAGDFFATGSLEAIEKARGNVWIHDFTLSKKDFALRGDGPVELLFDGAALEVREAAVRGPNDTRLTLAGFKDAEGQLDFAVDGTLDAKILESFTPVFDQAGGRVHVSAAVSGRASDPTVIGSAELEGGRFVTHDLPLTGKALRGRLEFSQKRIVVQSVEGSLNDGQTRVYGSAEVDRFVPSRLDLRVELNSVRFRYPEDFPGVFSGLLTVEGPLDDLVLGGSVDLERMRYSRDLDPDSFLKNLGKRAALEARNFEKKEPLLRFDLDVHVLPEARVDNNLARLLLQGDLKLVGDNVRPGMIGKLVAPESGRLFFRGNEFSVTRAGVELGERDRVQPVFDVHAETQVRDYRVFVHAYGPSEDLKIDLTSEPELEQADLVTLLTLGFTSRESSAGYGAEAGAGLVGETLLGISGLDRQVQRFIPKNTIIRDFSFHIATQYSDVTGKLEPMAQLESRFLSDSLKLRLSQPVISTGGRRAQAEYRFNPHLSAQAQWDDGETSEYSLGDLGLDLKLQWELD